MFESQNLDKPTKKSSFSPQEKALMGLFLLVIGGGAAYYKWLKPEEDPPQWPDKDKTERDDEHEPEVSLIDEINFSPATREMVLATKELRGEKEEENPSLADIHLHCEITVLDPNHRPVKNAEVTLNLGKCYKSFGMACMISKACKIPENCLSAISDKNGICQFKLDADTIEVLQNEFRQKLGTEVFPGYIHVAVAAKDFIYEYTPIKVNPGPGFKVSETIIMQSFLLLNGRVLDAVSKNPIVDAEIEIIATGNVVDKKTGKEIRQRKSLSSLCTGANGVIYYDEEDDGRLSEAKALYPWATEAELIIRTDDYPTSVVKLEEPLTQYFEVFLDRGISLQINLEDQDGPILPGNDTIVFFEAEMEGVSSMGKDINSVGFNVLADGSILLDKISTNMFETIVVKKEGYEPNLFPFNSITKLSESNLCTKDVKLTRAQPCSVEVRSINPPHKLITGILLTLAAYDSNGENLNFIEEISCEHSPGVHTFLSTLESLDGKPLGGTRKIYYPIHTIKVSLEPSSNPGFEWTLYDRFGEKMKDAIVYERDKEDPLYKPRLTVYLKDDKR